MKKRRILVAGCGAIGSVFACFLQEAGHRVSILGRDPLIATVRRHGLAVTGIWGDHHETGFVAETEATRLSGSFDGILITCKSFQTAALLDEIYDQSAPGGVVISLQNGLGNIEKIMAVYGGARTLGGRVIFGAEVVEPGRTRVTVEADPVLLGPAGKRSSRASEWATLIDRAGIACHRTDNIKAALWGKVLYNAALNPLGALLRVPYGALARYEECRRIMDGVIEEAFMVARAEGAALPWADAAEYRKVFYDRLVPATAEHRSSMLQDLERGRPTEIDAICGEICRRGERHGLDTPLNRLLALLVREQSRGTIGASRSPA